LRKPNHSVELKPKFKKILEQSLKFFLPFCKNNTNYNIDDVKKMKKEEKKQERIMKQKISYLLQ